jgi:CHAT domain-containing protein
MVRSFFSVFVAAVLVFLAPPKSRAQDPVNEFIARADSIATSGGDAALSAYVGEHSIIVGAAVGRLLDVAIQVGDEGQKDAESENIAFSEKVARFYENSTGSHALLDLVATYKGWIPAQRATRRDAKALEQQANDAKSARDFNKALELLNKARALYEQIGDARSVAIVWGTLGVVNWSAGNTDAVFTSYDNALTARRKIEDHILEGRTLNGLGSANYVSGKLTEAAAYYDQAIDMRRRTGDLAALGTSLTYRGNVYAETGKPIAARDAFEAALDVFKTAGEPWQRSEALNSIANLYYNMGRLQAADDAYLEAVDIAHKTGDAASEMAYRNNLALNLLEEYRFSEALDHLDVVQTLLQTTPDAEQEMRFHLNRGVTWMAMDELERAREDLLKLLELAKANQAAQFHLQATINLGQLLGRMGAYERAIGYADKAKALAYEAQDSRNARGADALAADMYWRLGQYDKALDHWNDALEQDNYDGMKGYSLQDRLSIAIVDAAAGHLEDARRQFRYLRPEVDAFGKASLVQALDFGIGHTYEASDPDSAAHYYEKGLAGMEQGREAARGGELRTGFLSGNRRRAYEEVARYYASLQENDHGNEWSSRAFVTIERAKARGLLDMLRTTIASQESPEEKKVLDELYSLDPKAPDYTTAKHRVEDRYESLREARIEASTGKLGSDGVVTPRDVQKVIDKKTTVLSYALGDSASLLWVVDRDGYELHELPPRSELRTDVERLRDALSRPGAGDKALRAASRKLYLSLVAPAENRLAGSKNLVIFPDGFLFEIPYEILLTADPGDGDGWSDLAFLASRYITVYAPSASVFVSLEKHKTRNYKLDLLAVGDPDFGSLDGGGGGLAQLPYTRSEVLAISKDVKKEKKEVLLGEGATEASVKRALATSPPRLLHLATHGLVDPVDPAASSVALCRNDSSGEDGYWHTLEILASPVDVGLVVLSACESARGKVSRGEGVVGLSRAFIASGAGGVVASLWSVSDESTATLMRKFYDNMLGDKEPAGEAMAKARLALLDQPQYAHPFYWSPFIVIGSERSPW